MSAFLVHQLDDRFNVTRKQVASLVPVFPQLSLPLQDCLFRFSHCESLLWTSASPIMYQRQPCGTMGKEQQIRMKQMRLYAHHLCIPLSCIFAYSIISYRSHWVRVIVRKLHLCVQRDVPGMTRAALPLMKNAGIKALSQGVNTASAPPAIPKNRPVIWKDDRSGASILLWVHAGIPTTYWELKLDRPPPWAALSEKITDRFLGLLPVRICTTIIYLSVASRYNTRKSVI